MDGTSGSLAALVADAVATKAAKEPDVPSIAVLPFANMSADPEQEYFCEGMAEEIIDALARLDGLRVVARTSAFQFRGKGHDLRDIGQKLNVKTVLEGSVRKAGNRLRINAQLINTEDGYHLWSERYDREMDDVFEVQDEIAKAVVAALRLKLLGGSATPVVTRSTDNIEAYNLFLRGRNHFARHQLDQAVECFERAVDLEPTYALAHGGLAVARAFRGFLGYVAPTDAFPSARDAALTALALDDTVADAHVALALLKDVYEWDRPAAEAEYRRALTRNPQDSHVLGWYAEMLAREGRADEAIVTARRALELDPLSAWNRFMLALVLTLGRRFDEATTEAEILIEVAPDYHSGFWARGWAALGLGRVDDAVEQFTRAATLSADPISQHFLGASLGLAGRHEEATAIALEFEKRRKQVYVDAAYLASVYAGLGDSETAVRWAEQAAEEHSALLSYAYSWFMWDPLRADPRFQALLRRMNFPETAETSPGA